MFFEIRRKLFHLTALIYVWGVVALPRQTFLNILFVLIGVVFLIETLRLKNQAVAAFIERTGGTLFRPEENQKFSGVLWMLLGVTATALVLDSTSLVVTCYLYLILGDAAASLGGKGFGGPKWGRSAKSISGSLSCFVVCLLVGIFNLKGNYPWPGIVLGALAATVLESGVIPLNDNLIMPLGSALLFKWMYKV